MLICLRLLLLLCGVFDLMSSRCFSSKGPKPRLLGEDFYAYDFVVYVDVDVD
jgi:hypothetical protein